MFQKNFAFVKTGCNDAKKCLKIIPETPFTYYGQKFYFTITFSTLFPAFTMYKPGATFVVALAETVEMPLSVVIV